jgi:hypothetical protein
MKVNPKKRQKNILDFWWWISMWLNTADCVPNMGELTVPSRIFYLPCGCMRRYRSDPSFRLFYQNGQWVHYCPHNNEIPNKGRGTPMIPPEKAPQAEIRNPYPRILDHLDLPIDDI